MSPDRALRWVTTWIIRVVAYHVHTICDPVSPVSTPRRRDFINLSMTMCRELTKCVRRSTCPTRWRRGCVISRRTTPSQRAALAPLSSPTTPHPSLPPVATTPSPPEGEDGLGRRTNCHWRSTCPTIWHRGCILSRHTSEGATLFFFVLCSMPCTKPQYIFPRGVICGLSTNQNDRKR